LSKAEKSGSKLPTNALEEKELWNTCQIFLTKVYTFKKFA